MLISAGRLENCGSGYQLPSAVKTVTVYIYGSAHVSMKCAEEAAR